MVIKSLKLQEHLGCSAAIFIKHCNLAIQTFNDFILGSKFMEANLTSSKLAKKIAGFKYGVLKLVILYNILTWLLLFKILNVCFC